MNLTLSLFLIALFWIPLKVAQIDEFLNSPSVDIPKRGEMDSTQAAVQEPRIHVENMLETRVANINASSLDDWTYFDFSRGKQVHIHDPSSLEWDLAFRREKVISNGGMTNRFGKAGLIDLGEKDFDSVTEVPMTPYTQDIATRTETQNPAMIKWYKYNYLTHKLSAKRNIYAVRTADNKYAKMQFISFYCTNKETGCITIRYIYQGNGTNSFLKDSGAWVPETAANSKPGES